MPIYEYKCRRCNLEFELIRPLSQADDKASCPQCGNECSRMLSTFASFSKGSDGVPVSTGGMSSCTGCTATSCSTCKS
ncbi:MAG: zinc ribbon domain-containing protein [Deltaproteobacteria bacterium]|nr:zinc ribbon domain-containing protein [Deltaproteobacteria bacterium]